jgi:LIVCS family branched-chain amino acid:cation transporter
LIFLFIYKKSRVLSLLGLVLSPILLLSLTIIIALGLNNPPSAQPAIHTAKECFSEGLQQGYNLLDLVAAFLYSTVVLANFQSTRDKNGQPLSRKSVIKKTLIATLIAAVLLSLAYIGLAYVGAFHGPLVPPETRYEEFVRAISLNLLGPAGGIVACIAVGLACLTTAISLTVVCSNFLEKDVLKGRGGTILPIVITLGVAFILSNLGFIGIANLIGPILKIVTPALILLCILNILYKAYEVRSVKAPVALAFMLSILSYYL